MKKILTALILTVISAAVLCMAACGTETNKDEKTKGNKLDGSLNEIVSRVCEKYQFKAEQFVYPDSDDAADILHITYGVENPEILEDYVLCKREDAQSETFAVFRFKDGTAEETIKEFKDNIQYYYVEGMYKEFKLYNPEEYKVAEGATYKQYDNALVLAIYDTEGNTGIFDITDTFKK